MQKYYIIPAEKVDKRFKFLVDKGSSHRVAEVENMLGMGKRVHLDDFLLQHLCAKKAEENNTIDLNAYARGILDLIDYLKQ